MLFSFLLFFTFISSLYIFIFHHIFPELVGTLEYLNLGSHQNSLQNGIYKLCICQIGFSYDTIFILFVSIYIFFLKEGLKLNYSRIYHSHTIKTSSRDKSRNLKMNQELLCRKSYQQKPYWLQSGWPITYTSSQPLIIPCPSRSILCNCAKNQNSNFILSMDGLNFIVTMDEVHAS